MKKFISFILVMILMMTLTMPVFASQQGGEPVIPSTGDEITGKIDEHNGCITINNVTIKDGNPIATYEIYQLLKLESFNFNTGSYVYSYGDGWGTFFTQGAGKDYLERNNQGILVWKGSTDAARIENFAKIALAYAKDSNIQPTKSTKTPENAKKQYTIDGNSITFGAEGKLDKDSAGNVTGVNVGAEKPKLGKEFVLELGYYLVDSTVGSLCGLSTTNPHGIINSKNGAPSIDKQVKEDLTSQFGSVNSADIGQMVEFRTTIHVHDGAQNYTVHDYMEEGFTFDEDSLESIEVRWVKGTGENVDDTHIGEKVEETEENTAGATVINYTPSLTNENGNGCTHPCGNDQGGHGCTFEIAFSESFCEKLNTNDRIIIFYSAMLNRNAEIGNGDADNPANENKTYLSYGEGHVTTEVSTVTKTYGIDLVKTDGQNKLLDGASFRIYSAETDGTEIAVVPLVNNQGISVKTEDGYNMYRRARSDEQGDEIIVDKGKVRIVGLDNGVYWLEEINHPEGYDKIESRQKFTIADNNLDAIIANGVVSTNSGVHVVNHSGTMLPETGGVGTVMFITCGMIVVLGAGVLLVTKKRMNMIK